MLADTRTCTCKALYVHVRGAIGTRYHRIPGHKNAR